MFVLLLVSNLHTLFSLIIYAIRPYLCFYFVFLWNVLYHFSFCLHVLISYIVFNLHTSFSLIMSLLFIFLFRVFFLWNVPCYLYFCVNFLIFYIVVIHASIFSDYLFNLFSNLADFLILWCYIGQVEYIKTLFGHMHLQFKYFVIC